MNVVNSYHGGKEVETGVGAGNPKAVTVRSRGSALTELGDNVGKTNNQKWKASYLERS